MVRTLASDMERQPIIGDLICTEVAEALPMMMHNAQMKVCRQLSYHHDQTLITIYKYAH